MTSRVVLLLLPCILAVCSKDSQESKKTPADETPNASGATMMTATFEATAEVSGTARPDKGDLYEIKGAFSLAE